MSASYGHSWGILVCLWPQNNLFRPLECAQEVCNASLQSTSLCDQCSPPPPYVRKCALYQAVFVSPLQYLPWIIIYRVCMNI